MTGIPGTRIGKMVIAAFRSLAEALIDDATLETADIDYDRLTDSFKRYNSSLPFLQGAGLVWGLRMLELAPILLRGQRFSRLSAGERLRLLNFLERNRFYPFRAFCLAMKSAAIMICFDDPAVEKAIGYSHGCLLDDRPKGAT
jgi:hypothetical protein